MDDAIQKVLVDESVLKLSAYVIAVLTGQVGHALKKWAEGESRSKLGWLRPSPKQALAALIANLAVILSFASTGALDGLTVGTCIALGLFQGVTASSFNVKPK